MGEFLSRFFGAVLSALKTLYNSWISEFLGPAIGRLLLVFRRPLAAVYGVLVVLGIGGVGTWITVALYQSKLARPQDLWLSILTYAIAIAATSCMDALWDPESPRTIKIITVAIGLCSLIIPIMVTWKFFGPLPEGVPRAPYDPFSASPWVTSLGYIAVPVLCWLFANIAEQKFENDPQAAAGGNPLRPWT